MRQNQTLAETTSINIQSVYHAYAGMLLGYIYEIVGDQELAESYLVKVFSSLSKKIHEINWDNSNTWLQLRLFTKNELANFNTAVNGCEAVSRSSGSKTPNTNNKYLNRMTDEQKHIFCSFYHHKKTIAQLTGELNKTELYIRQALKEAFNTIRRSHDN